MLEMPIEELDLPMRAYNSLKRNNIVKVGQLLQLSDDELLRMRNFGKKSLDEMKERLAMRGFLPPESEPADLDALDEDGEEPRTRSTTSQGDDEPRGGLSDGPPDRRPQARRASTARGWPSTRNLIVAVLRYEQVKTTEAKAKEIRPQVERMITLAKRGDLAARRTVMAELPNEPLVIKKLFDEIAPKYADRTSGYTRLVHVGQRAGDAAPIVQIELV